MGVEPLLANRLLGGLILESEVGAYVEGFGFRAAWGLGFLFEGL